MNYKLTQEDRDKMEAMGQIIELVQANWPNHSFQLVDDETGKTLSARKVPDAGDD